VGESTSSADVRFYFDPVCPFAWMTSKWVRMVAARRDYRADWRFISLRLINSHLDYGSHVPACATPRSPSRALTSKVATLAV
jgi:2-hydroxychromene-2-carboxylate isomerase